MEANDLGRRRQTEIEALKKELAAAERKNSAFPSLQEKHTASTRYHETRPCETESFRMHLAKELEDKTKRLSMWEQVTTAQTRYVLSSMASACRCHRPL